MTAYDPTQPQPLVDDVKAGPGGAMTDEVGVIAGELPLSACRRS
ncbi:hypothetical protein O1L60_42695 [Streptomyces diastatochromogenes]|nr:hypothetical protein [Streptomyces diastatochromogenes]